VLGHVPDDARVDELAVAELEHDLIEAGAGSAAGDAPRDRDDVLRRLVRQQQDLPQVVHDGEQQHVRIVDAVGLHGGEDLLEVDRLAAAEQAAIARVDAVASFSTMSQSGTRPKTAVSYFCLRAATSRRSGAHAPPRCARLRRGTRRCPVGRRAAREPASLRARMSVRKR
jgi:hypothetical protein